MAPMNEVHLGSFDLNLLLALDALLTERERYIAGLSPASASRAKRGEPRARATAEAHGRRVAWCADATE